MASVSLHQRGDHVVRSGLDAASRVYAASHRDWWLGPVTFVTRSFHTTLVLLPWRTTTRLPRCCMGAVMALRLSHSQVLSTHSCAVHAFICIPFSYPSTVHSRATGIPCIYFSPVPQAQCTRVQAFHLYSSLLPLSPSKLSARTGSTGMHLYTHLLPSHSNSSSILLQWPSLHPSQRSLSCGPLLFLATWCGVSVCTPHHFLMRYAVRSA